MHWVFQYQFKYFQYLEYSIDICGRAFCNRNIHGTQPHLEWMKNSHNSCTNRMLPLFRLKSETYLGGIYSWYITHACRSRMGSIKQKHYLIQLSWTQLIDPSARSRQLDELLNEVIFVDLKVAEVLLSEPVTNPSVCARHMAYVAVGLVYRIDN